MRLRQLQDVSRELDRRDLHAEAQAEVGHLVLAGVACRLNFALDAPLAKAPGHQDAPQPLQILLCAIPLNVLGIDPLNLHSAIVCDTAVADGLIDGFVGVLQLDIDRKSTRLNSSHLGISYA